MNGSICVERNVVEHAHAEERAASRSTSNDKRRPAATRFVERSSDRGPRASPCPSRRAACTHARVRGDERVAFLVLRSAETTPTAREASRTCTVGSE